MGSRVGATRRRASILIVNRRVDWFTLLELVMVMTIIVVLAAVSVVALPENPDQSARNDTQRRPSDHAQDDRPVRG